MRLRTLLPALALFLPSTALAFSSYFYQAHHNSITREAARSRGFQSPTDTLLAAAVEQPDWDENSSQQRGFKRVVRPNALYRRAHHFDRNPGVTNLNAFKDGATYMRAQKQLCQDKINQDSMRVALAALGRCLHALEDCFSHSDYIDLSPAKQQLVIDALYDGSKNPPDSMTMTGYDDNPAAIDDENPAGDPYPHGTRAKDYEKKNAECSLMIGAKNKFMLAREAAVAQVQAVLDMLQAALTQNQWDTFRGVAIEPRPELDNFRWACAADVTPAGGSVACFDPSLGGNDLEVDFQPGNVPVPAYVELLGAEKHLGQTDDMFVAQDGAAVEPGWDIRVGRGAVSITPGVMATAHVDDSVANLHIGEVAGVYYMDHSIPAWTRVSGGSVSSGTATFPVDRPGIYAPGYLPLITPVTAYDLSVSAEADRVELQWSARVDFATEFRVMRRAAGERLWARVDASAIAAAGTSRLRVVDAAVLPGTEYDYQVSYLTRGVWQPFQSARVTTAAATLSLRLDGANPALGGVRLAYSLPRRSTVSLEIFTLEGRQVRQLMSGSRDAGSQRATWDGLDESGRRAPAGAYVARLTTPTGTARIKFVRIG